VSNHARRRAAGRPPTEADDARTPRRGILGWLLGGGTTDPDAPVAVATVDSRATAELLVGYLRDKGIHAVVSADDEGGLAPNIAAMRRVRVLVRSQDRSRAQEMIDEVG
jgi:hypothetical protein